MRMGQFAHSGMVRPRSHDHRYQVHVYPYLTNLGADRLLNRGNNGLSSAPKSAFAPKGNSAPKARCLLKDGILSSKEAAPLKGSDKSQATSQDKTKFPHPSKDREQVVMTTEGENKLASLKPSSLPRESHCWNARRARLPRREKALFSP